MALYSAIVPSSDIRFSEATMERRTRNAEASSNVNLGRGVFFKKQR